MTHPGHTRSPRRQQIMSLVEEKQMTAAEIGAVIGMTREATYNLLKKMVLASQIRKVNRSNQAFWAKYIAPKKVKRETPIMTGTTKGKLDLSFMQSPYRAGSMDAYSIPSRGIK